MNIIPGCIFMGSRDAAQALMLARQAFYYLNYLHSLHGSLFSRSDGERCSWSTCLYMYHAERCPDLTAKEGVAQRSSSHIQAHVAVRQSWDPDFSGEAGEKGPHPWDMLLSWGGYGSNRQKERENGKTMLPFNSPPLSSSPTVSCFYGNKSNFHSKAYL